MTLGAGDAVLSGQTRAKSTTSFLDNCLRDMELLIPKEIRCVGGGKEKKVVYVNYITNSLHLARKYARIFVRGHYLFREANIILQIFCLQGRILCSLRTQTYFRLSLVSAENLRSQATFCETFSQSFSN